MAKNDFKAFATDRNANVISQEEWEALPSLLSGFTAGKASSAQVNKVIRQASFIAAALAQFVSDKTQRDVLDNGDLPGFVELLGSGFAVEYLSRKNPFGDIKSDGTVKTALENLGLGEGSFGFRNLVAFTTAGVTSWTVPEELRKGRKCYVKVIGGGASGGIGSTTASAITCGGGGGGGGVAEGLVDLTGINSVSITVGAGGAPVSGISVNGKNGGSSSFGTYMSASGGYSGSQPSGGLGAVGVGGTINTSLGPGSPGSIASAASGAGNGGSGGGPGGAGSFRDTANGKAVSAVGPGGGGAGLCPNSSTGQSGAGADGAVYIYW
ncbi:hypothetical protein DBW36_004592 [Escherichia coli]|nr:hypothetical protein [Escherichia coli]EGI3083707.1 hypothetical protein [Escherichia coli]EGL8712779.1 hypothetical protein [Escherichia coli]EHD1142780.1 hypothetical protein [Escherichia coli]EJA4323283.1 hypothetical protein [Escherichia coli]